MKDTQTPAHVFTEEQNRQRLWQMSLKRRTKVYENK